MLNKLGKEELKQFRDKVLDKELSLDDLDNVKAAIPNELVEEMKEEHRDLFRK